MFSLARPRCHGWPVSLLISALCATLLFTKSVQAQDRAEPSPVRGGTIVVHTPVEPESLNAAVLNAPIGQEIGTYLYEPLLMIDWETLAPIPWIAESMPKLLDDRISYEFRLRRDVTFSDGRPVTGADIVFYLKAVKNPHIVAAASIRELYKRVDRAELVDGDPYRLRVVMTAPNYYGAQIIGSLQAYPRHIWDPQGLADSMTFYELNRGDSARNPAVARLAERIQNPDGQRSKEFLVGSGPYRLLEWTGGSRIVLERNPTYWNSTHRFAAAYLDRLQWRVIADPAEALAELQKGEIDFMPTMEKAPFVKERKRFASQGLVAAEYDPPLYTYLGFNLRNRLFADSRVRNAISRAIDLDTIIRKVYGGLARPVASPIYFRRTEFDSTILPIRRDLDQARALMEDAGWEEDDGVLEQNSDGGPIPFRFELLINSGNARRKMIAEIIASQLKQIGVEVTITSLDWAPLLNRMRQGRFDAFISGWAMSATEGDLTPVWHSRSFPPLGSNYVAFNNAQADKLIESLRTEFDQARRLESYREIQRIIYREQPCTFLTAERTTGACNGRFRNVKFYGQFPYYNLGMWWEDPGGPGK